MAIELIGAATAQASSSITIPSGHASGDLIVMCALTFGGNSLTVPSGWTAIAGSTNWTAKSTFVGDASSGAPYLSLYYKRAASSSETSGTWTLADRLTVRVIRGSTDPYGHENNCTDNFGINTYLPSGSYSTTTKVGFVDTMGIYAEFGIFSTSEGDYGLETELSGSGNYTYRHLRADNETVTSGTQTWVVGDTYTGDGIAGAAWQVESSQAGFRSYYITG